MLSNNQLLCVPQHEPLQHHRSIFILSHLSTSTLSWMLIEATTTQTQTQPQHSCEKSNLFRLEFHFNSSLWKEAIELEPFSSVYTTQHIHAATTRPKLALYLILLLLPQRQSSITSYWRWLNWQTL